MKKNCWTKACPRLTGIWLKNVLIMKLTMFLLCINFFAAIGSTYSQHTKFTLSGKDVQLEDVLNEVKKKSEFRFFYNHQLVDLKQRVEYDVEDATVSELLDQVLDKAGIKYEIVDKTIILSPKEQEKPAVQPQKKTIKGKVTDEKGLPLPGVSIIVKGTTTGIISDSDGNYTLEVPDDSQILVFSFVGMKTEEIPISGQDQINISLKEEALGIEEVVAIGYGTVKKSDLTGAVSSVKAEDIITASAPSVAHMLQGKASGLEIRQNSAQPGGGLSIKIRGAASIGASNEPLIVVDGFPLSSYYEPGSGNRYTSGSKESTLSMINPNDIESVEVLKDASSTAIYGARAANGVILITTKRGAEGRVKVDYNGSYSIQRYAEKPQYFTDSKAYMETVNESFYEHYLWDNQLAPFGTTDPGSVSDFVPLYSESDIANAPIGTDWMEEILQTGTVNQQNLAVTGGTTNTKYLISFNYYDHDGILFGRGMKRLSGRFNLDQKINELITLGVSTSFSQKRDDNNQLGGGGNENAGVMNSAYHYAPNVPVRDENGNYSVGHPLVPNPVSYQEIDDLSVIDKVLINSYIELTPLEELKIRMNIGADVMRGKRSTYLPTTFLYGAQQGGKASIAQNQKDDYLFDINARYSKTSLNEVHKFTAMAGYSYQEFNWEGFNGGNYKYLSDAFKWYDLGGGEADKPTVDSYGGKDFMASYFGRINYSLLDRYLLTATFRADGASNFSKDNKWGYFPSVALGWRITEESFMSETKDVISNLKLRLSYGQTGNSSIGHRAFAAYRTGANFLFGSGELTGVYASQLENPNLKWETTTEYNLGLDLGLFDNRLSASFEYFNKEISDLLATKSLLSYHEVSSIAANIGETQSKGVELQVTGIIFDKPDFSWETNVNFSTYNDTWKTRDPEWKPAIYQNENDPIRIISSYVADGIVQIGDDIPHMNGAPPGSVIIKDIDGYKRDENGAPVTDENGRFVYLGEPDGKIDEADIVNFGNSDPAFSLSLNNTMKYKNFDLNFYFYGNFNQLMWQPFIGEINNSDLRWNNNGNPGMKDRWTIDNQNNNIAGTLAHLSPFSQGDLALKKTWFARLNNVTLGYTIPKRFLGKYISNARFYVEGQNLLLFTNYEGVDPETDGPDSYPNQRTYSVGVNVTF